MVRVYLHKGSSTPGPNKYSKVEDWSKVMKKTTIAKAERITITDDVFRKEKRSKSPAPNSYKPVIKTLKNQFKWTKDR